MPSPIFSSEDERKIYCIYNSITATPDYCRGYLEPGVLKDKDNYEDGFPGFADDAYMTGVILSNGVVTNAAISDEHNMSNIVREGLI